MVIKNLLAELNMRHQRFVINIVNLLAGQSEVSEMKLAQIKDNFLWLKNLTKTQKKSMTINSFLSVAFGIIQQFLTTAFPSIVMALLLQKDSVTAGLIIIIILSVITGMINWAQGLLKTKNFWDGVNTRMNLVAEEGRGFIHLPYFKVINAETGRARQESAAYGYDNDDSGVGMFTPSLNGFLENALSLILVCILTFLIAWWCPLLVLITVCLSLEIIPHYTEKRKKLQANLSQTYLEANYIYRKSFDIAAGQEIRIYQMSNLLKQKVENYREKVANLKKKIARNNFNLKIILLLLNFVCSVPIYLLLIAKTLNGKINLVLFSFLFSFLGMLNDFIKQTSDSLSLLLNADSDITKSRTYLDPILTNLSNTPVKKQPNIKMNGKNFSLELKNVAVRYPNSNDYVLKNINLKIKAGTYLALVGLNGAGKTTLTLVILGLIKPVSGQILLNGHDISELDLTDYQKLVTPAFQENILLAATLENNITIKQNNKPKLLEKTIVRADLRKVIAKFPQGLQTELTRYLDDEGITPSGGETQKIILARALYRNTILTILDEPTAALDALAESKLYQKIHELFKNKASIFVSHRLASTKFATQIILMSKGKIIARGTHDELMSASPDYRELFNLQKKYYQKEVKNEKK